MAWGDLPRRRSNQRAKAEDAAKALSALDLSLAMFVLPTGLLAIRQANRGPGAAEMCTHLPLKASLPTICGAAVAYERAGSVEASG